MTTSSKDARRSRKAADGLSALTDALQRVSRHLGELTSEDLRRFGMTMPRWLVLSQLAVRDGQSIGALSRSTVTKQSSLTRVVDQMERDRLVERHPAEDDQRIIEVWLTEEGRSTYAKVVPLAVQRAHQALDGLRDTDIKTLTDLLQRLLNNVRGSAG